MERKQTDKITVIVPCWNYGMFLQECVDSLLNQTVLPKKIIIMDDHSTDNTFDIATNYALRDTGVDILVIRNDSRLGTIENENNGAKEVQTEWMFYLDADDKLDITYIEKVLNVIESHDDRLFVVYSDMHKFGLWDGDWVVAEWDREALRQGNYINGHSVFRKELFDRIGGLKDNGHFEDQWMWLEMMELNDGFYGKRIPEPLVWYRRHDYGHRTDKSDVQKRG